PEASIADTEAAIAAARTAFDTTDWSTNTEFRAHSLEQFYAALRDNVEELRDLTIAEVGATRMMTHANQLQTPFQFVQDVAGRARADARRRGPGTVAGPGSTPARWADREPSGVSAAIAPSAWPPERALARRSPARAAGCSVILKGAPHTPLPTLALGEII